MDCFARHKPGRQSDSQRYALATWRPHTKLMSCSPKAGTWPTPAAYEDALCDTTLVEDSFFAADSGDQTLLVDTDPFNMDDLKKAISLELSPTPAHAQSSKDSHDRQVTLPAQTSSMSRRRLASNIPALKTLVDLPPPPTDTYFKEIMHQSSPRGFARRSPGLTIKSPNLLTVRSINLPELPVTPVDQVMNIPLQPPEAPRQSVKKSTAYGSQFKQSWGFSPDTMPPLSSPTLEDPPAAASAFLFNDVPSTPVDQVMTIPDIPPELPRRRERTATARTAQFSTAKCLPLGTLFPSAQATPTQCNKVSSPKFVEIVETPSRSPNPLMQDANSPFIDDAEQTPMPLRSARSRMPKHRPTPLFKLPERPSYMLTPRSHRPLSPASPHPQGTGGAKLPLASPFWAAKHGAECSFTGAQTSTPLVGVPKRIAAESTSVGTPSYFNAPSYFVNH